MVLLELLCAMGDQICKEPCVRDDCIGTEEKKEDIAEFNVPEPISNLPQVGSSGASFGKVMVTNTRQSSIHNTVSESSNSNQQMAKVVKPNSINSKQPQQQTNSVGSSKTSAPAANRQPEPVIFKSQPAMKEAAVWNEVQQEQAAVRMAGRGSQNEDVRRGVVGNATEAKACERDAADAIKNDPKLLGGEDQTQVIKKDAADILAEAKKHAACVPEHLIYQSASNSVAALETSSASSRQNAWAVCEALWARAAEKGAAELESWPKLEPKRSLADIISEAEESAAAVPEDLIYRAARDCFAAVEESSAADRQATWALCHAVWARAVEKGAKAEESWPTLDRTTAHAD
eukprot:TRINITY_DN72535_c0_g1_i1.p1 TRINITY_DN72535_c0_g1~~TRINITY_DN72535_c0_g1_i1.p1  ORF type:complete len:346 (+),score=90.39 TRINITY_DN72535_c0_g1_i1:19-1056(+)